MTRTYTDAAEAVAEAVTLERPDSENEALEVAQTALHEFIDTALIYTADVLEIWDETTNENIVLADYDSIADAIIASTYFQLLEDWADAVYDGIDDAIDAAYRECPTDWDSDDWDRDDALAHVFGTRD